MRAARREALLGLGLLDRRFGWPLEMVVRAAAEGWRIDEVDVTYLPRQGRSKVTGTVRGTLRTVRDMVAALRVIATLIVLAKAPAPGRVKTRLSPPLRPEQAAALARAALEDTLAAMAGSRLAERLVVALDGEPDGWLPAGFEVDRPARRAGWRSALRRRSRTSAIRRSWSPWTRPRSRPSCSTPAWRGWPTAPTPCSAPRRTAATGRSGSRDPTRACSPACR